MSLSDVIQQMLRHVDLRQPLPAVDSIQNTSHRWYLWWGTRPLGMVHIHPWQQPLSSSRLARLLADAIAPAAGDLLYPGASFAASLPDDPPTSESTRLGDLVDDQVLLRLEEVVNAPPTPGIGASTVAVIVCTRGRPEQLRRCLRSLQNLERTPDEILVIDNAPTDDLAEQVASQEGVGYAVERQPGLSRARNAGIKATTAEIIVFTDDDVVVDPQWITRLLSAFDAPDIMAVTGLVMPATLETEASLTFEDSMGGFGGGFRVRDFGPEWLNRHRRRTAPVWQIGAGANMAFRRGAFDRVGNFDHRLGAGAAGCSEDSEFWYRLLAGGWRCRYEPWAVVHHFHRDNLPDLMTQAEAYMRGHVVALGVQWDHRRQWGELRRIALTLPRFYAARGVRLLLRRRPDSTFRAALWGYISGVRDSVRALRTPKFPQSSTSSLLADGAVRVSLREFVAKNPFDHPRTLGLFYSEKMRAIHAISPASGVKRVVEIGGGQSGLAAALYPRAEVITVDVDFSFGTRRDIYGPPGREFIAGDGTSLPLADRCADVVTMFDVVEHIQDDTAAVREALRILRPGGSLLLTTPAHTWRFPYYSCYSALCPTDDEVMAEWGHVRRGYHVAQLNSMVGNAHDAFATFISPITVLTHDVAFSRLPPRMKRLVGLALSPLVTPASWLHRATGIGTEIAMRWTRP